MDILYKVLKRFFKVKHCLFLCWNILYSSLNIIVCIFFVFNNLSYGIVYRIKIVNILNYESLIKKIAQDEVRGGKVDADKAVDNARAKIKNITKGIKSGKQAVATLIKAGYDEQDAIEYVKANSEKKPKAK